ncbi:MAG: hypothetical protein ACI30I_10480, partial [Parabacteroides sp.]
KTDDKSRGYSTLPIYTDSSNSVPNSTNPYILTPFNPILYRRRKTGHIFTTMEHSLLAKNGNLCNAR